MNERGRTIQDHFTIDGCLRAPVLRSRIAVGDVQPGPLFATACTIYLGVGTIAAGKESGVDVDDGFAVAQHADVHVLVCHQMLHGDQGIDRGRPSLSNDVLGRLLRKKGWTEGDLPSLAGPLWVRRVGAHTPHEVIGALVQVFLRAAVGNLFQFGSPSTFVAGGRPQAGSLDTVSNIAVQRNVLGIVLPSPVLAWAVRIDVEPVLRPCPASFVSVIGVSEEILC